MIYVDAIPPIMTVTDLDSLPTFVLTAHAGKAALIRPLAFLEMPNKRTALRCSVAVLDSEATHAVEGLMTVPWAVSQLKYCPIGYWVSVLIVLRTWPSGRVGLAFDTPSAEQVDEAESWLRSQP